MNNVTKCFYSCRNGTKEQGTKKSQKLSKDSLVIAFRFFEKQISIKTNASTLAESENLKNIQKCAKKVPFVSQIRMHKIASLSSLHEASASKFQKVYFLMSSDSVKKQEKCEIFEEF